MPLTINKEFILSYVQAKKRWNEYDTTSKLFKDIQIHAEGLHPGNLLSERRPGESEYIMKYRKMIYQPKTQTVFMKIMNTLGKIRRSSDWSVKYETEDTPQTIPEKETLAAYCELNFPEHASLTRWYFDIGLKQQCMDPNAVALVHPYNDVLPVDAKDYVEPYITIFNSDRVLDYVPGQYAVLQSDEFNTFKEEEITYNNGLIFYVPTPDRTFKISQVSVGQDKWQIDEYQHNLHTMPCFKLKGLSKKRNVFQSRISGAIPALNTAVVLYSDKQAEIVQHVHSEKWIYQTQQCKDCVGMGRIPQKSGSPIQCPSCSGNGVVNTSPYNNLVINPNSLPVGEKNMPIPPAGYIQKTDTAIMVKTMSEEIKQEIWDAYSAVNMEFLMDSPLATSGESKKVDRDELNNFVYTFAEDAVGVLDNAYYLIALMRYGYQFNMDLEVIKDMVPEIPVPEKFDLLNSNYLIDEIGACRDAGISSVVLMEYEQDFTKKKFTDNPEMRDELECIFKLDPLPATTDDNKLARKQAGGVTAEDYIISCNIVAFVRRAFFEDEDFYNVPYNEQVKKMKEYAQEKKDELDKDSSLNPPPPPVPPLPKPAPPAK